MVLLLFLRSLLPTIIVSAAIPVSVIGTFVAIAGLGLSINVISLAGLPLPSGWLSMLQSSVWKYFPLATTRHECGKRRLSWCAPSLGAHSGISAYNGDRLCSRIDVAASRWPAFPRYWHRHFSGGADFRCFGDRHPGSCIAAAGGSSDRFDALLTIPGLDHMARGFALLIMRYATLTVHRRMVGLFTVAAVLAGAAGFSYRFMPQLDYLPDGNANFVFGRIFVPPGYSMDETVRIAEKMEAAARPLWEGVAPPDGPPAIERFFFVAFSGGAFAGPRRLNHHALLGCRAF